MNTILIIEDDKNLREALQTKLVAEGYSVRTAESADIGLQLVIESKPDLILLDVMTNSLHGSVFLNQLRGLPEHKNDSKVIVLTNLENELVREKVSKYTIEAYLIKADVTLEEIAQKTRTIFGETTPTPAQ